MTPKLQSRQASETVNNQAQGGPLTSRSTLQAAKTPTSDVTEDNNEHIDTDHSDNTINDLEAVTAHNQEVIERQQLQLWHIQQEIEYENNQRELRELNLHLKEGPQPTTTDMTSSENNADPAHELRHWATIDIAPLSFWRLIKPWEPCLYAGGVKSSR